MKTSKQLNQVDFSQRDYTIFLPQKFSKQTSIPSVLKSIFGENTKVHCAGEETSVYFTEKEHLVEELPQLVHKPVVTPKIQAMRAKIKHNGTCAPLPADFNI